MIDLHCHSTASDGTLSPTEIIAEAQRKNLRAIALTDHDTVDGIDEFLAAAANTGLLAIPGIELASRNEGGANFHIIGLFVDHKSLALQDALREILRWRNERNLRIVENLRRLNVEVTMEEVAAIAGNPATVGRPHFAECLVRKGYVSNSRHAFAKYLDRSKPGYSPRQVPTPERCIEIIHQAGGLAIWAHPFSNNKLTISGFRYAVGEFVKFGLDGVEAIYPRHTPNQRKMAALIARENGIVPSGGTDFHGAVFPELELGTAYGPFQVPDDFLAPLIERHEKSKTSTN